MPFRFICGRCRTVLFECEDLETITKAGFNRSEYRRSPIENFINYHIGAACPKCGKPLKIPPLEVEVYPIQKEGKR